MAVSIDESAQSGNGREFAGFGRELGPFRQRSEVRIPSGAQGFCAEGVAGFSAGGVLAARRNPFSEGQDDAPVILANKSFRLRSVIVRTVLVLGNVQVRLVRS